jgi:hypothetical protein
MSEIQFPHFKNIFRAPYPQRAKDFRAISQALIHPLNQDGEPGISSGLIHLLNQGNTEKVC